MSKTDNKKIIKIAALLAVLTLVFYWTREAMAAAPFTNIGVCTEPPDTDLINPNRPKIMFENSGNDAYFYQIVISKSPFQEGSDPPFASVIYDSGVRSRGSSPILPGTYSFEVPPGTLPIDNSTYNYAVRMKDVYDWSPYASGSFTLGQLDGKCAQNVSFCEVDTLDTKPPSELCLIGTPSIENNANPWTWTCLGYFGGNESDKCCAEPIVASISSCGPAVSLEYCQGSLGPVASDLCAANNTATDFEGDGSLENPWTWNCTADDPCHTSSVSCSAFYKIAENGQCGEINGTNFCESGTPSAGLCLSSTAGTPYQSFNEWNWTCGTTACGGTQVSCSAGNLRRCGWIETNP